MRSVEHFKNYVHGVPFGMVSDHKALQSVLNSNKGNKTYSSRLTKWVDRLLPFVFSVVLQGGHYDWQTTCYLPRHPFNYYESAAFQAEKLFNDWFTVKVVDDITPNVRGLASSRRPIKSRECENSERKNVSRVLRVHVPTQANKEK